MCTLPELENVSLPEEHKRDHEQIRERTETFYYLKHKKYYFQLKSKQKL